MPIDKYGVLKCKVVKSMMGEEHYQILAKDESDTKYRIAVNVKSRAYPSEVLYFASEDFKSENITELQKVKLGFTEINKNVPPIALDYIRGNLFDMSQMKALKATAPGPDNDLNEKLESYIKEAIENDATLYAFGQKWGPEKNKHDKYFDFLPGNGIHDIHMNQGNVGKWEQDNGIWQDGGLLINFENTGRWVAIFLAFQSQKYPTDDNGNSI